VHFPTASVPLSCKELPLNTQNFLPASWKNHKFNVWLINTGWGKGRIWKNRIVYPLKVTRQIIRSIQKGSVDPKAGLVDPIFGFIIPQNIEGINPELLQVCDQQDEKAQQLKKQFDEQLEKISVNV